MAITWDQIGAALFNELRGSLSPEANTLEEITRPAVDGRAFRFQGQRGEIRQLQGFVDQATTVAAAASQATYRSMVGTLVSIILAGVTYNNYLILNVENMDIEVYGNAVGGQADGAVGLFSTWTVVYGGT
jgi:hypothetical protein